MGLAPHFPAEGQREEVAWDNRNAPGTGANSKPPGSQAWVVGPPFRLPLFTLTNLGPLKILLSAIPSAQKSVMLTSSPKGQLSSPTGPHVSACLSRCPKEPYHMPSGISLFPPSLCPGWPRKRPPTLSHPCLALIAGRLLRAHHWCHTTAVVPRVQKGGRRWLVSEQAGLRSPLSRGS